MSDGQLGNPFAFSSPDASAPNPAAPMPGMPMPGAQQGATPAAPPAQSPGFLGQSPDFWRSLAQFGGNLASAANARTSDGHLVNGTGFGGAFGSAIGQTMQDVRQDAVARSNLSNQQQQNYDLRMKNQITAMGMPLLQAQNDMRMAYWKNPNDPRFALPGTDAGSGAVPPSSDYARTINAGEGSGKDPNSSAVGGFIDGTWSQFAKENPHYFNGMSPDQISAARANPDLRGAATDWLATKNAPVLAAGGVQPSGISLGMSHYLGPQATVAMMKADPTAPASDILTASLGPDTTRAYVAANPNLAVQTAGGLRNHYANVPNPSFLSASQPDQGGQPSSGTGPALSFALAAQYEQQAAQYKAQADKLEQMQKFGVPISGDPALLRTMAGQASEAAIKLRSSAPIAEADAQAKANVDLRTAGLIQLQKSQNMNLDLRPGGLGGLAQGNGVYKYVKNPQVENIQGTNGTTFAMHVSPAPPDAPPGTKGRAEPILGPDGQQIIKKLPANVQDARNKAYADFAGKDADSFVASGNTQGLLTQMNTAADELNKQSGFLNTGPLAPERIGFASKVNDITNTFGLGRPFDPSAIGAWEELTKATRTAGFELASHYEGHARQAAQTIENATSAVPSELNSPIGFQKVSAGINEIAQQNRDAYSFAKQPVYDAYGDLTKAETDFYTKFPAQMYARRAISAAHFQENRSSPYSITSKDQSGAMKEMANYLPGTFVNLPNGKTVQVPARPDAPPIPDYLAHYTPQPATPGATQ